MFIIDIRYRDSKVFFQDVTENVNWKRCLDMNGNTLAICIYNCEDNSDCENNCVSQFKDSTADCPCEVRKILWGRGVLTLEFPLSHRLTHIRVTHFHLIQCKVDHFNVRKVVTKWVNLRSNGTLQCGITLYTLRLMIRLYFIWIFKNIVKDNCPAGCPCESYECEEISPTVTSTTSMATTQTEPTVEKAVLFLSTLPHGNTSYVPHVIGYNGE